MQKRSILYDKSGEEHYNLISAFIKSMRGSDPDAALYYLARMIEGGASAGMGEADGSPGPDSLGRGPSLDGSTARVSES
jgi:hypothetical protein